MKVRYFAFILIALIGLSACTRISALLPGKSADTSRTATNQALTDSYQAGAHDAMLLYWNGTDTTQAKNKLLELKVPSQYLDLHLKLVIAFDQYDQGKAASDQTKVDAAVKTINDLASQYTWLK